MRSILGYVLVAFVVAGFFFAVHAQNVALTPSVLTMASTAVAANCPAPAAGITTYCFGADKMQVSPNGGAYVVIWPAGAVAGVKTVNLIPPDLNGNVTVPIPTQAVIAGATAPLK
jgi:hypothetical protein